METMTALSSAAGYLALLEEPDQELKVHAAHCRCSRRGRGERRARKGRGERARKTPLIFIRGAADARHTMAAFSHAEPRALAAAALCLHRSTR